MRVLPAGPFGLLLEFGDGEETQRCFGYVSRLREAEASRFAAVVDVVPAERTVLVIATFDVAGQKALRDLVIMLESPRDGSAAVYEVDADTSSGAGPGFGAMVELSVRYDGPDLAEVAALTGLGEADVVAAHTSTEFTVAFTGFAPGFAYLRGLPEALHVPRRAEPRTRVETGSVGLAGPYSGIYPRASPRRLAADRTPGRRRTTPVGLRPRRAGHAAARHAGPIPGGAVTIESGAYLRVVRAGLLTTVQDLGRPGYAHLGVPRSGAADPGALRLANRLVGNDEGAAALETTLNGCAVFVGRGGWMAVTGAAAVVTVTAPDFVVSGASGASGASADAVGAAARLAACSAGSDADRPALGSETGAVVGSRPGAVVGAVDGPGAVQGHEGAAGPRAGAEGLTGAGATDAPAGRATAGPAVAAVPSHRRVVAAGAQRRVVGIGEPFYAPAGSVVDVGSARVGVRSYLAVAGGVVTPPVVVSRSFDLLSGLGGDRGLAEGDVLPVGEPLGLPPTLGESGLAVVRGPEHPAVVRCLAGPRDDWFLPDALAVLGAAPWVVGGASNRTALRLEGPVLARARDGELTSEGLVPGAVQVPPDGRPVVFLADHPVTGGYPVIACVDPRDLGLLGQARPGSGVRFRVVARA